MRIIIYWTLIIIAFTSLMIAIAYSREPSKINTIEVICLDGILYYQTNYSLAPILDINSATQSCDQEDKYELSINRTGI